MTKSNSKLIMEWILLILAPPITLILVIEFTKVFFGFGVGYGILFLIGGIIIFIAEISSLFNRTKKALGLK